MMASGWAAAVLWAGLGALSTAPTAPLPIVGGDAVDPCAWPSAGRVRLGPAACGAVLIHPRVVAVRNDCFVSFPDDDTVEFEFGEPFETFTEVSRSDCSFDGGFGVCVLPEALSLPYAPIVAGCETSRLREGEDITLVGFGDDGNVPNYDKRAASGVIESVSSGALFVGDGIGPCLGDAGSGAFIRMADGSWRLAGMATDAACGEVSAPYQRLTDRVPWIEEVTGFDLTPCHDERGEHQPGSDCEGFFAGDARTVGSWEEGCVEVDVAAAGGVCADDGVPPVVSIVVPDQSVTTSEIPFATTLEIEAEDADGVGVREVWIDIDGEVLPGVRDQRPYQFGLEFPEGTWEVTAYARDWSGNESVSDAVTISVGQGSATSTGAEDDESTSGGDTSTSGDESSSGAVQPERPDSSTAGTASANDPTVGRGGCRLATESSGVGDGLFLWVLLLSRRRFRSRTP